MTQFFREGRLTEILILASRLVAILLLPSLRRMKFGDIELEPSQAETEKVTLESSLALISEPMRHRWLVYQNF